MFYLCNRFYFKTETDIHIHVNVYVLSSQEQHYMATVATVRTAGHMLRDAQGLFAITIIYKTCNSQCCISQHCVCVFVVCISIPHMPVHE